MRIDRKRSVMVGSAAALALLCIAAAPAGAQDLVEIPMPKQPRKLNVLPYPDRPAKYVAPPAKAPVATRGAAKPKPAAPAKPKAKKRR